MRKIATHVSVLVIGAGIGLGSVAVASPASPPTTARTAATDRQAVSQLRKLNTTLTRLARDVDSQSHKLDLLNRSVSGYTAISGTPSLRSVLQDIERNSDGL